MSDIEVAISGLVSLALLIWAIITLTAIKRRLGRIAEAAERSDQRLAAMLANQAAWMRAWSDAHK